MPTHAVLGATGGTGSAVLHSLLESNIPNLTINLLVRSREKLLSYFPEIESTKSGVTINIFTGSITDSKSLTPCLANASIIHHCIAAPEPSKKTDISQRTAEAVIKAVEAQTGSHERPTVLLNRSSALNPAIKQLVSPTFMSFVKWAVQDIYSDLTVAADLYSDAQKRNSLHIVLVDAPNIFHRYARKKVGYELFLSGPTTIGVTYADFGDAFVEIAKRKEEFQGKAVGVRATGEVKPVWGPNLYELYAGTMSRLNPFWY